MQIPSVSKLPVVNIALDTISIGKQAIVFVNSKRSAQKSAVDIAKASELTTVMLDEISERALTTLSNPTEQCKTLARVLKKGIAFHHAGLNAKQRGIIEDEFRAGNIKIICATPTLAAGLDMPAFRTILKDLKRFTGNWGMQYIPVLEYEQMAGRAGRPGKEEWGEAIAIAGSEREMDEIIDTYINGEIEPIHSKLAVEPVLRMYVLSLVSTRLCKTQHELLAFFSKSFWAHQFTDMQKLEAIILRVVSQLAKWEFILVGDSQSKNETVGDTDFTTAKSLLVDSELSVRATPLGVRVSQLYLDPYSANHMLIGLRKIDDVKSLTPFGLIHLLCQTLELRPLLRVKAREGDTINQFLLEYEDELILPIPTVYDTEYEDFFNAVKTTSYFLDWLDEFTEDMLLQKYDIRPGEINAKNEIMDWLLYCCVELCHVINRKDLVGSLVKIRDRLKYGVKEELLGLLAIKGVGRVRARKLYSVGLKTRGDLKKASIEDLVSVVGKGMAVKIHSVLGVDVDETAVSSVKPETVKTKQSTLF